MALISTHALDTSVGRPAAGVAVRLELAAGDGWIEVARAVTDDDGRVRSLAEPTEGGTYRLTFDTGAYLGPDAFYPEVVVVFAIADAAAHHHVPLLLSPFGYTTYRGS
ncbi:MAG: hydroxyisourate hydrolase [Actinobacteria bacterium RBG_16_68_21]|nr:MAG: hydroxyisourate hydrolase [Actinobacteria bacterium RBG_16_68_21]